MMFYFFMGFWIIASCFVCLAIYMIRQSRLDMQQHQEWMMLEEQRLSMELSQWRKKEDAQKRLNECENEYNEVLMAQQLMEDGNP